MIYKMKTGFTVNPGRILLILSNVRSPSRPRSHHRDTTPQSLAAHPVASTHTRSLVNNLDPDCPIAWPNATAPPFTFTFSGSSPSSRVTAKAATENASFNSTRSTSLRRPASLLQQLTHCLNRRHHHQSWLDTRNSLRNDLSPSARHPSSRARRSEVTTTADAPSLTLGALPAVTVPFTLECRLQFPEHFHRRVFTHSLISIKDERRAFLLLESQPARSRP